ncbi:MAG TPA: carbohydrate binding domain-containing protein [Mobilitalea sp.]|nr:carbohydrate binding domain-containing protein [Mobilitalea sp.]
MGKKLVKVFRKFTMVAFAFVLVCSTVSPASVQAAAKAPSLNATKKTIVVGKSFNFNVKNKIKGATYKWEAGNNEVVSIDQGNGVVTGVGVGTSRISCRISVLGKNYRLTANVTVLKPAVKVTITNPVKQLDLKDYYRLKTKMTPASSTDIITWTSSDSNIAKVDNDGSFAAMKAGTVTITATSLSGRSDSVTIKIIGDGETAENTDTEEETKDDIAEVEEEVKVLKTVYSEDFTNSIGAFVGRGDAKVFQTTAGKAAESGKGYASITGRIENWHGAIVDVTKLVVPGASYRVTGWARYTAGADTENIKITQERTSKDADGRWVGIASTSVKKGEWTKLTGTLEVSPTTTQCSVYFEADTLIDFFVDNIVIEQLDKEIKEAEVVVVEKAKVGDIVYKSDFEDGSILDTRASSERTNTTATAKSGKASVQVKRNNGWDGAGVKFTSQNKIVAESLYGMTVHTSVYVMYKDGADEVNFKLNNKMEMADDSDSILSQIAVKKGEWTLLEADCFIADGAVGDLIFIETENDGALTFYMDDIEIKVVK